MVMVMVVMMIMMVMNCKGLADRAQLVEDADVPLLDMTADEVSLSENDVVPFPHEHHMDLGLELMNVFDAEIAFFLYPGTGQMAKAILMKNQHAVCVCRNKYHRDMLMQNLKDFAKSLNLVNLSGGPPKPADLVAYEQQMRNKPIAPKAPPSQPRAVADPTPPPPALVIGGPQAGAQPAPAPSASVTPATPSASVTAIATAPKLAAFGSTLL